MVPLTTSVSIFQQSGTNDTRIARFSSSRSHARSAEATVTITFVEENYGKESKAEIHVVVTGAPEEAQEELPSGITGV